MSTLLGVAAHSVVEGTLPDPALLLVALAVVSGVALLLLGRERSFEAIAAALVVGQAVTHAVLCAGHTTVPAASGLTHAGHGAVTGLPAGSGYLAQLYPGHTMLLAHLLAAGTAAWWLRQGEAAVWAAVGWIWPALQAMPALTPVVALQGVRPRHETAVRVLRTQIGAARAHPRRGPPARVLTSRAPAYT